MLGEATSSLDYVRAVQDAQRLSRPLLAQFGRDLDVLVTPTMAVEPPLVGSVWDGTEDDPTVALLNCYPMAVFTSVWNATGLPAISVPTGMSDSDLPIGVQLVAGPGREDLLLRVAAQLEQALPWVHRRPAGYA